VFEVGLTLQVAARVTVLCGSLMPGQLEPLPARKLLGPIHFCVSPGGSARTSSPATTPAR